MGLSRRLPVPTQNYGELHLSPEGRHIAVEIGPQIWIYNIDRDTLTRLTFEGSTNTSPAWTADGKRIAFLSNKEGRNKMFWQLADGSGSSERLDAEGLPGRLPKAWSPDGQFLAFQENNPDTQRNIWILRLSDHKAQVFLRTPFTEGAPQFSPDGRWLSYASNESGRPEVYIQPYPGPGGKWQVSTDGGTEPVWARNGDLFYRSGSKMMVVDVTTQPTFSVGKPRMLFEGQYLAASFPQTGPAYDVSPDGQQFLMVKQLEQQVGEPINVVLNWVEDMKRRAPAGKQ